MSKIGPEPVESQLKQLFLDHFQAAAETITRLPLSGSNRCYYRLAGGPHTAIGVSNSHVAENNSYFYFTELLRKHQVRVPELYAVGKDRQTYLQQDLGSESLFDRLLKDGYTPEVKQLFADSLAQLAKVQWLAGSEADYSQCYGQRRFDEKAIMADLLYFKYYFADLQPVVYDRNELMEELEEMARELGRLQPQMLMYRDFQSRNVMLHEGQVWFIDFQGAMQGPPQYDVASMLWQARAQLPAAWRDDLLHHYLEAQKNLDVSRVSEAHFRNGYLSMVLLRLLQVLGAYGFRGLLERKPHFLASIGPALDHLDSFLNDYPMHPNYPALRRLLEQLSAPALRTQFRAFQKPADSPLKVSVVSFSYKQGLPQDESGHGGGYIFDCRGILNPGRFEACKKLSGKDADVISFLENETKMPEFLARACDLVSLNVEDYLSRGFDHLSIAFGCTGGQHRSVYAATKMAEFLQQKYGVPVSLQHLNEERWVR